MEFLEYGRQSGNWPETGFEEIRVRPVALHTSGGEPVEFVFARAGIGSACTLPNLRNAQIFHQSQGA